MDIEEGNPNNPKGSYSLKVWHCRPHSEGSSQDSLVFLEARW